MEQNTNFNSQPNYQQPKPDNNLVLAIITTVCCCLPLGIVAIVQASKVNSLYAIGQYAAANQAAASAKKWSIIGIVVGVIWSILYAGFYFIYGAAAVAGGL